jgi:hypothetical protein
MHPLFKALRLIILFTFTWGVIVGGTVGIFFLVRDTLTENNTEAAVVATVAFLFIAILVGERFAYVVNCVLARLSKVDAPACSSGSSAREKRNPAND